MEMVRDQADKAISGNFRQSLHCNMFTCVGCCTNLCNLFFCGKSETSRLVLNYILLEKKDTEE